MKIVFLGAGNMGTALAHIVSDNLSNEIVFWSIEEDVNEDINKNHVNSKYLKGIRLRDDVVATSNINEALINPDIVVFSVPSNIVRIVCEKAKSLISKNVIIIDLAKGLENKTNKRMSEVISEYFSNPIISVGGPCIANELVLKVPSFVVYASENKKALIKVKETFEREFYKITLSKDVKGVEFCGTLKNVIAILAGLSDGLGYGMNTKSGLICKGLEELRIVCKKLGVKDETINGLAGLGDLIVTCTSLHSRNRRFGEFIAKGESPENAKKMINQVIEGEIALKIVYNIIKKHNLDCPLIIKTYNVVFKNEEVNF